MMVIREFIKYMIVTSVSDPSRLLQIVLQMANQ